MSQNFCGEDYDDCCYGSPSSHLWNSKGPFEPWDNVLTLPREGNPESLAKKVHVGFIEACRGDPSQAKQDSTDRHSTVG